MVLIDKKMEKIDKFMAEMEQDSEDSYSIKTDVGYKYLLNWTLKRIAESFMTGDMSRKKMREIYNRLMFLDSFFPYANCQELFERIRLYNRKEDNFYYGVDAIVRANVKQLYFYHKHFYSIIKEIMKEMDKRNLLLHTFVGLEFEVKD